MIALYADVARAFVEVATPWTPALIVAVVIMRAPDLRAARKNRQLARRSQGVQS